MPNDKMKEIQHELLPEPDVSSVRIKLADLLDLFAVVALVVMFALVLLNVGLRYLFSSGIVQTEELARFLFIGLVFLGFITVALRAAHLSAPVIVDLVGSRAKLVMLVLADLACIALSSAMTWGFYQQAAINMSSLSPILRLPSGVLYAFGALAGASLAVIITFDLLQRLQFARRAK